MTTPARERSAFGQFQLNRSAIDVGVDYTKVRKVSTFDMAQMIRDGATLAETCEAFGLSTSTIRTRLSDAGWSCQTGQPLDTFTEPEVKAPRTPVALFIDQPWVDQALCAQTDPESFFPEKGGATHVAKATCAQCFVQAECLDYALTTNERFGVWGGLSERERRALNDTTAHAQRAQRPLAPHGTDARCTAHRRAGETPCRPCLDAHNLVKQLSNERTAS